MRKEIPQHIKDLLDYRFIQALCAAPFVDKVYLYGSRARGDHEKTSDIDLAVTLKDKDPASWIVVRGIVEGADTLLKIDCLNLDEVQDESFKKFILNEAIELTELLE